METRDAESGGVIDVDLRLKNLPEEESTMDEHHSFTDKHVGHISDIKK